MSMDNCRICFQFRNVDTDKLCKKCRVTESKKVPMKIKLMLHKSSLRPESITNGKVITKEDWFFMKRLIDNFYSSVTSDDIDWMNKEKEYEQEERAKRVIPGFIYLMKAENGYYKIGRALDVDKRNKDHMRDYPLLITVLHSFYSRNYIKAESYLLKMFADKKLQGEWFALEKDDVDFITGITDEIAQRMF